MLGCDFLLDGGTYVQTFLGCYGDCFYRRNVWGLLGIV